MKIAVISGSPKGKYSITLQTAEYISKRRPGHEFSVLHAGQRIKALERDPAPLIAAVSEAELILFCYPVYTFLAPSQLHRAIELIKASGIDLSGKFAAQLTTSKHFYDCTAHRYIEENCGDMGLAYLGGLSADMDDLLCEKGRADALAFFDYILWRSESAAPAPAAVRPPRPCPSYERQIGERAKTAAGETVVVADFSFDNGSLRAMADDFAAASDRPVRTVDIGSYPFGGGCLGCFNCAVTGKCVYNDGFDSFLRNEIQSASAIVYAFTVRDHSMGARFKMYDDRQFCNGHRPVTAGKPTGYLVAGDYASEANLRLVIEGRADVGGNFLAGVATDSAGIEALAATLSYALDRRFVLPRTFLGVGGLKVFRDLIYLMRGFMKADHRFYKAHGLYDFPQKKPFTILKMYLLGLLISSPAVKAKLGNRMNEGMIAPYKKVTEAE